jgi:RNA processing factor Prp31
MSALPHRFISNCDLVQGVPPALRSQAARIIGGKTALLARIDAANGDPTGEDDLRKHTCHMSLLRFRVASAASNTDVLQRQQHTCKVQYLLHGSSD